MSKITPPLPLIETFYYYFSTTTLIICWSIAPILFYIILTQSNKLNSIKWLILNHIFWCLALQTLLGLVKPLFLSPAAGGVQIGFFRSFGDFKNTAAAALIGLVLSGNCVFGLFATICSRYLYVYPSKLTKYLTFKFNIAILVGILLVGYALIIVTFYSIFQIDTDTIHKWAMEYDPFLLNYLDDSSFFFIPHSLSDRVIPEVLAILGFVLTSLILLSIFFTFQISINQSVTTTGFQKSLIISSIMQIYLTIFFLIIPIFILFIFIYFDIPHTASVICFLTCVIMMHCFAEFIATLYFISPYRKFIIACYKKARNANVQDISTPRV